MKKYYGLTNTEAEIMNIFWDSQKKMFTFKELMEYTRENLNKEWKKQTLSTFLANLQKLGLLEVRTNGRCYVYYAISSREEYIHKWTKELVRADYDNSIGKFMAAFTGGSKLSKEEAEEIKNLIDS